MAHAASLHLLGDPRTPIYPLSDVARYLRFSPQRTRYWLDWIPGRHTTRGMESTASFLGLVSVLVMKALREYGVKTRRIRSAEKYLVRELGPYPLARNTIWTDRAHVLFNRESPLSNELPREKLEAADMGGQLAFVKILKVYLRRIELDTQHHWVGAWLPRERIRLDPQIQFGEPCVAGTRVRTSILYSMHLAGDSTMTLASSFDMLEADVVEAVEWEAELRARAA